MTRFCLISALLLGSAVSLHHDSPVVASSAKPAGKRPQEPRTSRSSERLPLAAVRAPTLPPGERAVPQQAEPPAHDWSGVAECESSGDWHINTGNGYMGGLQMDAAFWANYGGLRFAARPDLATREQQITVAERGLAVQGVGAWPYCGRYLDAA